MLSKDLPQERLCGSEVRHPLQEDRHMEVDAPLRALLAARGGERLGKIEVPAQDAA